MARLGTSREIRLRRSPHGLPNQDDFEIVESVLPRPGDGQVAVQNLWLSIDPYIRGLLTGTDTYMPAIRPGQLIPGAALGRVIEAGAQTCFAVGDIVRSHFGWRDGFVSEVSGVEKIPPTAAPIQSHLDALGAPGLTAYVGLLDIGRPRAGETVLVSGAAGSVGGLVCQIAKLKGCRVVASAGTEDKCDWLRKVAKVDAVINYRAAPDLQAAFRAACPDGLDVYFDNVGGDHLEAALAVMNDHGRIAACGAIAQYNDVEPRKGPSNLFRIVTARLLMQGFLVTDHWQRLPESAAAIEGWMNSGLLLRPETVSYGLDSVVDAFAGLFRGDNLGKTLVRLDAGQGIAELTSAASGRSKTLAVGGS